VQRSHDKDVGRAAALAVSHPAAAGRDDIPIPKKVEFDEYSLNHRSFLFDLKILVLTVFKVTRAENVSH
jgi:lipopolysaccharide/colanic/teichoic acid biosynthesis glycosyltransferase